MSAYCSECGTELDLKRVEFWREVTGWENRRETHV